MKRMASSVRQNTVTPISTAYHTNWDTRSAATAKRVVAREESPGTGIITDDYRKIGRPARPLSAGRNTYPPSMDPTEALAFSRYARAAVAADPAAAALAAGDGADPFPWAPFEADLAAANAAGDAGALDRVLRTLRRRLLVHTALRDLTGRADLIEVCGAMTRLAEVSLRAAVVQHHAALAS